MGFLVQEKKRKIDFQDGCHLGFPSGTILAIFDLQVARYLLSSFKSIGLLVQEKKRKIDFQDGRNDGHLEFLIGTVLAILIYKSPQYFLPSVKSIGPRV